MADLRNVNVELASRIIWIIAEADARGRKGRQFWITTGWRDMDEQRRLYAAWQAALLKCNGNTAKASKIASIAAVPGTSMHGRVPAMAVDLACDPVDNALRAQLIKEASLITPVGGEPWHCQLSSSLKPLPKPTQVISAKAASSIMGNKAVKILVPKHGLGYYIVTSDGGVFTIGKLEFLGSAGGTKLAAPIVDAALTASDNGYYLLGEDAGVFAFGDAQFLGNAFGKINYAP